MPSPVSRPRLRPSADAPRRPCPSWSRCALVLHGVVALWGRQKSRLRWLRPVCAVVAHQVAVVSTYAMLGYYDVVRRAALKRSITGWRVLWVHAVLHYGPVAWWADVPAGAIRGWHKGVALVLHALWFWLGVGGTRRGLEDVYAEMPGAGCWGELGLVSLVGVLTAGSVGAV